MQLGIKENKIVGTIATSTSLDASLAIKGFSRDQITPLDVHSGRVAKHGALRQQINLASLELTLYHEDSSSFTTPVREDGQFALGGLPEGHYCGALAPAPQGFSYAPISIDIREGGPSNLNIILIELPQNIPFQAL